MSEFNIEVKGGSSVRLPTAGKYCDRDIVVTAPIEEGSYDEGYADGIQAECDRFWDAYQDNGNRTNYAKAFCSVGWTDQTFRPKHNIMPSSCSEMFRTSGVVDIVGALERTGVTFDTSNATTFEHMFAYTNIEEAPHLNLTKAGNVSYLFNACRMLKKASLTFAEATTSYYQYMFSGCYSLQDLEISGVIDIELSLINSSELTSESVQSVVDALKDLTGQTAKTLKFNSSVLLKLTDVQIAQIGAKNWML